MQDKSEELANVVSHAIGVFFGIAMLNYLPWDFAHTLYKIGFLFIFTSSSIYHAVRNVQWKRQLQKIDHIAIYFMIAGSYTPFLFACLPEGRAWLFFSIMWSIVLVGTVFKLFFTGRFEKLSLLLYLGMGWMLVFIIRPFYETFSSQVISLVVVGGLLYTGGVFFYANDKRKYFHFIWHLFVLGGAIAHFYAILNIMK